MLITQINFKLSSSQYRMGVRNARSNSLITLFSVKQQDNQAGRLVYEHRFVKRPT
jgi:hypothetical protein